MDVHIDIIYYLEHFFVSLVHLRSLILQKCSMIAIHSPVKRSFVPFLFYLFFFVFIFLLTFCCRSQLVFHLFSFLVYKIATYYCFLFNSYIVCCCLCLFVCLFVLNSYSVQAGHNVICIQGPTIYNHVYRDTILQVEKHHVCSYYI